MRVPNPVAWHLKQVVHMIRDRDVSMSSAGLPLNCPRCGVRLTHKGWVDSLQVYTCDRHGEYWLDVNGYFRTAGDNPRLMESTANQGGRGSGNQR